MNPFFLFLYTVFLRSYKTGAGIKSLWNKKAQQWIQGQKNSLLILKNVPVKKNTRIWFHCASVGEFEQARPLIELIKKEKPLTEIILTFFSPSGFELRKNYPLADVVLYLPMDSKSNSKYFLDRADPDVVVFVKYELWYYYLNAIKEKKIPAFLISAIFRQDHWLNSWFGKSFRPMLQTFKAIFVQNENSEAIAEDLGCKNVIVSGDTRVDRVLAGVSENKYFPEIENWIGGKKIFLAGSTWKKDEEIIVKFLNEESVSHPDWKWIIVPHEISEQHLQYLKIDLTADSILHSDMSVENKIAAVLIIDKIGILAYLYRHAQIAFVGGGFGKGIHNILEPAVYGLPIIVGPKYQKFSEAVELILRGAAFSVKNYDEFKDRLGDLLSSATLRDDAKQITAEYISKQKGATEKVYEALKKYL